MTIKNALLSFFGLPLLIVTIAVIIYNSNDILEFFKTVSNVNNENCKVIRGGKGLEDFAQYDERHLIGASNDNLKLWELKQFGINKTDNGKIFVFDLETETLKLHEVKGFPQEIAFHPHGVHLYKQAFIYVINHAYKFGGERIEVLKIQKETGEFSFIYEKSLVLPEKLMGITNDLIVVGPHDNIYITTYISEPDSAEGRDSSFMKTLRIVIPLLFKIKQTFIYYCESSSLRNTNIAGHFKCVETVDQESLSLHNNGIAYDEENELVFVSNLIDRQIRIFKRDENNKLNLKYLNDIDIGFPGDNVHFKKDEDGNTILTVGVMGRVLDHMNLVENSKKEGKLSSDKSTYFGGVRIKIQKGTDFADKRELLKNTKVDLLVMQNDLFKGISSAFQVKDKVYMSSWADDGLLVCKLD